MTTQEIAERLVQLVRAGENLKAIEELYADDVVSIESDGAPDQIRREGRQAVVAKNKEWFDSLEETHSELISEPLVIDTHFTCTMTYDITMKKFGRMKFSEICLYEVKAGKIVFEQFFYRMRD